MITEFKIAVQIAKDKQKGGKSKCKKLEKDMNKFKNNKEGKIDELKVIHSFQSCGVYGEGPFFSGRYFQTESSTAKVCSHCQATAERSTDCYLRARSITTTTMTVIYT